MKHVPTHYMCSQLLKNLKKKHWGKEMSIVAEQQGKGKEVLLTFYNPYQLQLNMQATNFLFEVPIPPLIEIWKFGEEGVGFCRALREEKGKKNLQFNNFLGSQLPT